MTIKILITGAGGLGRGMVEPFEKHKHQLYLMEIGRIRKLKMIGL